MFAKIFTVAVCFFGLASAGALYTGVANYGSYGAGDLLWTISGFSRFESDIFILGSDVALTREGLEKKNTTRIQKVTKHEVFHDEDCIKLPKISGFNLTNKQYL
ncbi:unnamed protein product [Arctia plantaginis]|uniref:Uncharacterized protein n=1 Tax=Arctia plantaginis TaxID=874455 RepID=A0A8S0ZHC4_ARCPL|nr:unnamed protein product [Arctia plantaginis]